MANESDSKNTVLHLAAIAVGVVGVVVSCLFPPPAHGNGRAIWVAVFFVSCAFFFLGLALFISPSFRRRLAGGLRVGRSGLKVLPRWDSEIINKLIRGAKQEVWMLQTWIPMGMLDINKWEESNPGVAFRFLLADKCLVPLRLACRTEDQQNLSDNLAKLRALGSRRAKSDSTAVTELSRYQTIPFGPILVADDRICFGLYLADTDSMKGPMFVDSKDGEIGRKVYASLQAAWAQAPHRRVSLGATSKENGDSSSRDVLRRMACARDLVVRQAESECTNAPLLAVLRHGETWLNKAGLYSSRIYDAALSSEGESQADKLRSRLQHLPFQGRYASHAHRTRATLRRAYPLLSEPITSRAELRDRDMGLFDTRPKDLHRHEFRDLDGAVRFRPEAGESLLDVALRITPFLARLVTEVMLAQRMSVIVCTHESVVQMIRILLSPEPEGMRREDWVRQILQSPVPHCEPYYFQVEAARRV